MRFRLVEEVLKEEYWFKVNHNNEEYYVYSKTRQDAVNQFNKYLDGTFEYKHCLPCKRPHDTSNVLTKSFRNRQRDEAHSIAKNQLAKYNIQVTNLLAHHISGKTHQNHVQNLIAVPYDTSNKDVANGIHAIAHGLNMKLQGSYSFDFYTFDSSGAPVTHTIDIILK